MVYNILLMVIQPRDRKLNNFPQTTSHLWIACGIRMPALH